MVKTVHSEIKQQLVVVMEIIQEVQVVEADTVVVLQVMVILLQFLQRKDKMEETHNPL